MVVRVLDSVSVLAVEQLDRFTVLVVTAISVPIHGMLTVQDPS